MKRPDWIEIYKDTAAKFSTDATANELVLVTRESARLGAAALRHVNAQEFYHNNGAAERELRAAADQRPSTEGAQHSQARE